MHFSKNGYANNTTSDIYSRYNLRQSYIQVYSSAGLSCRTSIDGPSAKLKPLYNREFYHITIKKWSQICTRIIRKCLFKDILFLGTFLIVIPIVNPISNLDHEGVELSYWIFVWLISAPKDTIKKKSDDMFRLF